MIKSIYIIPALLLILTNTSLAQFRATTWNMSVEKVKEVETMTFQHEEQDGDATLLGYTGKAANIQVILAYIFLDNELVGATYSFDETYLSAGQYIDDYKRLKGVLTNIYGSPREDKVEWNNPDMKQIMNEATALSSGFVQYSSSFLDENTMINMSLKSAGFEFSHEVVYMSVANFERFMKYSQGLTESDF